MSRLCVTDQGLWLAHSGRICTAVEIHFRKESRSLKPYMVLIIRSVF